MAKDLVREFGYLTLGSRLKRIGERLQGDVSKLSTRLGLDVPAGQYPLLAALNRAGPTSVGTLARLLGVRQPAVTRSVGQLKAAGLVTTTPGATDQRQTSVDLTPKGRALVRKAEAVLWPAVEAAVRAMCDTLDGPLLVQLGGLEDALGEMSLDARAAALINQTEP